MMTTGERLTSGLTRAWNWLRGSFAGLPTVAWAISYWPWIAAVVVGLPIALMPMLFDLSVWVNEKAVQRIADRINSDELYELIDGAEFTALSESAQNEVWNVLLLFANSGVPTAPGSRARSRLIAIFGGGSATINNVVAAITYQVSRALAADVGAETVREGDVGYARTLA